MHEHLGLKRWPFPVVPEPDFCDFIADRRKLRDELDKLLRALSRQDASSIHLLWSWFGAGKTHTLHYIAKRVALLHRQGGGGLHTVYSEFPKSARSFLDLYKGFALGLDIDALIEAYLEISTSPDAARYQRELLTTSPDLVNDLQVIVTGRPADQVTATRWLRGDALPVSQFRKVGISQKISSSEEASRILTALVRLLSIAAHSRNRSYSRVIWLLDEFRSLDQGDRDQR